MIKLFAAFTIFTVMISTAAVYNLKQATYNLEEKKRDISTQILKDREAIKVLKAEMAYLSRPARLERLSRRHLVLDSTQNEQLSSEIASLSMRNNVQMANLPIDNFQLLLPRKKPDPIAISRRINNVGQRSKVKLASFSQQEVQASMKNEQNNQENQQALAENNLYQRILAKIGK